MARRKKRSVAELDSAERSTIEGSAPEPKDGSLLLRALQEARSCDLPVLMDNVEDAELLVRVRPAFSSAGGDDRSQRIVRLIDHRIGQLKAAGAEVGADRPPPARRRDRLRKEMMTIPVAAIDPGDNIRSNSDPAFIADLAETIRELGLIEPLVVQKADKRFSLIAGFQRLEAVKLAGDTYVQAVVYEPMDAHTSADLHLVENFQRKDLSHMDVARWIGQAYAAGFSTADIRRRIGGSEDFITKRHALLRLAKPIWSLVDGGVLPLKHAELIARVADHDKQCALAASAIGGRWDTKKKVFAAPEWGRDKDVDVLTGDRVRSMEDIRVEVAQAMHSIAAGGWPADEEFAGKPPCAGCVDCTATQPLLFAELRPAGSDRKGFCLHRACYEVKTAERQKQLAIRRRQEGQKLTQRLKAARKAGLDVCDCGRVANEGEEFKTVDGVKKCPKCRERKTDAGGRKADPKLAAFRDYCQSLSKWDEACRKAIVAATDPLLPQLLVAGLVDQLVQSVQWQLGEKKAGAVRKELLALLAVSVLEPNRSSLSKDARHCFVHSLETQIGAFHPSTYVGYGLTVERVAKENADGARKRLAELRAEWPEIELPEPPAPGRTADAPQQPISSGRPSRRRGMVKA